jgi:hypothetical protein
MWSFKKKRQSERKVFGFPCDQKLALGGKMVVAQGPESEPYPTVERGGEIQRPSSDAFAHP